MDYDNNVVIILIIYAKQHYLILVNIIIHIIIAITNISIIKRDGGIEPQIFDLQSKCKTVYYTSPVIFYDCKSSYFFFVLALLHVVLFVKFGSIIILTV